MRSKVKRILSVLIALAMVLTVGAGIQPSDVFADGEIALTVQKEGKTVKTFTMEELEAIAVSEGDEGVKKTYNYTAWNVNPSFSEYSGIQGPTVEGILTKAGVAEYLKDTGTVTFKSVDKYVGTLTGKQLREDRYFYPHGDLVTPATGYIPVDAYEPAEKVPAVISLSGEKTLYVGQVAPNEQNNPIFVKFMAQGGVIDVSTKEAERCSQVKVDKASGTLQQPGTEITISAPEDISWDYDKIYFTFESDKSPNYGCPIYNCGPKQDIVYKPVCEEGNCTLKIRVKGYGKQDSVLQTFTYYAGDALTVKVNGVTKKSYATGDDVAATGKTANNVSYSGFNNYPTRSEKTDRTGITVASIIEDATGLVPGSTLPDDAIITFTTGVDGYTTKLTAGQIFEDRYYYPKGAAGTDSTGGAVKAAAYEGKKKVPAILETGNKHSLIFGQTEPNEQNFTECVHEMLMLGQIDIDTESSPEKCEAVTSATPADGSTIVIGQKIELPFPSKKNKRDKICYLIDPEEGVLPGLAGGFYNYSPKRDSEKLSNKPVFNTVGKHTLKVRTVGYGKKSSDVTTFTYNVVPAKVTGFKASSSGYNALTLRWSRTTGATGYEIYRKSGSSYKLLKTITSGSTTSYKVSGLKTGTTYYYKIRAVANDEQGQKVRGSEVSASGKPIPASPSLSLKTGKRKATVKWSRVSGASGYQILRSTRQSSGFKVVKTIKKGSTRSYVNRSLKKGKTYYYKVRAYKTVSGKKVYGSYSTVKKVKIK